MSLSNEQKSLLKRAQRQAALSDGEYREALRLVAGVSSSTAPEMGDRHLDKLLSYFEAIYWRKVGAGELVHAPGRWEPFLRQGYWASKNTAQETSRDRYTQGQEGGLARAIATLEREMAELGFNGAYCNAIRLKVTQGSSAPGMLWKYQAALKRTVDYKRRKAAEAKMEAEAGVEQPF